MPDLNSEGVFDVKVVEARYQEDTRSNSKAGDFLIILKLETTDDLHTFFTMYFNNETIQIGKSAGMTEAEASIAKLKEIGVEDVVRLQEFIDEGLYARVVMKREGYVDKSGVKKHILKAKYLNALPKSVNIKNINLQEKFDLLFGKAVPNKEIKDVKDGVKDKEFDDDIPF